MALVQQAPERRRGPSLAVLASRSDGTPMEEALRRADENGYVIASIKRLCRARFGSRDWQRVKDAFDCWAGDMVGFDLPGKPLGATIEYVNPRTNIRYIFPVPDEYRGVADIAIVSQHPDFFLAPRGNDRIVQAHLVGVVEDFPTYSGYYAGDPEYDLATGREVDRSHESAKFLWRPDKRVGLVALDPRIINLRSQILSPWPCLSRGVVVECEEDDVTPVPRRILVLSETTER